METDFFKSQNNITACFVVGGNDNHYCSLNKAIKKLEIKNFGGRILILEVGNKLKSFGRIQVINKPNAIDFSSQGKIGFKFWKLKYYITQFIDTEYGIYLDTDTVMVNNNLNDLFKKIEDQFGSARHFWVPTIGDFQKKAVPEVNLDEFIKIKSKLSMIDDDSFYAGGIFLYKNTLYNMSILQDIIDKYDELYENSQYISGLTDEVFFAGILNKEKHIIDLGGSLNHCCMLDMKLELRNNIFYGGNFFEREKYPISFFHCDTFRRLPYANYDIKMSNKIKEEFLLNEGFDSSWSRTFWN